MGPVQTRETFVLREVNILALVKGEEHYVFVYDEESRQDVVQIMRDWAADPRLSFSWFDAAVLSQRLQQKACEKTRHASPSVHRPEHPRFGSGGEG